RASCNADFFSTLRIDTEASVCLLADRVLGLRSFDDVCGAVGLLLSADRQLAAVNTDVHVRFLAVVSAGVVTHDDGAVWLDKERRAVGEGDAGASARLCLHGVAGIKFGVSVGRNHLASGGANNPHVALEGDEPRAGRMIHDGDVPKRIAVQVHIDSGTRGEPAKNEDGDYQIDETLLNNPPIIGKATGFIRNHGLIDGEGSRCESVSGSNNYRLRNLAHGLDGLPEDF